MVALASEAESVLTAQHNPDFDTPGVVGNVERVVNDSGVMASARTACGNWASRGQSGRLPHQIPHVAGSAMQPGR